MVFTNRKKEEIELSFAGESIERVSVFRFLGVILEDKLTWKNHIAYVFRFLPTERVTRCTKNITRYSNFVCLFFKGKAGNKSGK